ncbi:type III-A CRISPR-associated RAMP protein Csm3 [Meiothermus sp. QL-1]|uniref:type III-A CRISPR-associated RAMP protein Csm3 n=1 Tax=Meiothermus sp. QL-1 TaxID=2058095 RepID=UPI000E09E70E|nr:type III-A CRISPR-associated RAMP protein Csm3 [Meiothermus sp. QL-1]RDI94743.1 type III-A CRISPR-associated RAMP protein Csm3 [Meiothermus sp. QL-1]
MKLLGYKRIHGIIRLKSGLRIGMSKDQMTIGDVDNPVIRNPLTEEPYIPGSSLKGKMRYLLEWYLGGDYIARSTEEHVYVPDDPNDPVGRIFGSAPSTKAQRRIAQQRGPTRLLVRDAYLTPESKRALEAMIARGGYLTEVKQEVFIPRIGGDANPRTAERVPAGAKFAFEMVYRVMDTGDDGKTDQENFKHVQKALELLQLDGLGGYISRGYGQVELEYQVEDR